MLDLATAGGSRSSSEIYQELSEQANFAEVISNPEISLDFKQSDIYDISHAILHNEGTRLTIIGPAKVGGHIA